MLFRSVILYLLYDRILMYLREQYMSVLRVVEFVDISEVFTYLIPIMLAIGVGIGFLGSFITVRRQIRQVEVL